MYKKILAPLDGSELAECSLQHVRAVAAGCQVPEVVLLRVVEPMSSLAYAAYAETNGEWLAQTEEEEKARARDYIEKMAVRLKKEGIAAQAVVISGKAADEILNYANKNQVELIIMSTHGRSGISRWAFGSVADRIVRHAKIPVLIVSAPACRISSP
ncbi:MAG: UspA protein [Dehalococcoidales bacterium]|nr:UspA protein [Dehalococcoidales bacterium]